MQPLHADYFSAYRRLSLENITNIRVPVIAAIEGRAHVHSEYALLASVIVAGEGATFHECAAFRRRHCARVHFIQPLKERIVREVGCGLSLEGASAAALVKSMQNQE